MIRRLSLSITIIVLLAGFIWLNSASASPPYINYQGQLFDANGLPVADGSYNMEFKLYTGPTCDYAACGVWTETRSWGAPDNRVAVSRGLFSILLGKVSDISGVDFNQSLYLGVNIGGSTTTPSWDGEMTPRKELGSVPYSVSSYVADTLDNLDSLSFLRSDADDNVEGLLTVTNLPAGTGYGQGSFYINPSTATSSYTLFGVSVGALDLFKIDAEGDVNVSGSLSTNATTTLAVTSGNVGIGTAVPERKLEVYDATPAIRYNRVGEYQWTAGVSGVGGTLGAPYSYFVIRDDPYEAPRLVISHTDGNVGIGTTEPGYKLDIYGALRLQPASAPAGANGVMYYDSGVNKFKCYQNGAWINCVAAAKESHVIFFAVSTAIGF